MCFHNTDIARIRGIFTDACARFSKYGEGRVCVKKILFRGRDKIILSAGADNQERNARALL